LQDNGAYGAGRNDGSLGKEQTNLQGAEWFRQKQAMSHESVRND